MGRLKQFFIIIFFVYIAMYGCSSDEEKKVSHLKKGRAYFDKGEYKSALLEFKNAVQIDPEYIEAYINLGETYLKSANPQEAFRAYSIAKPTLRAQTPRKLLGPIQS